VLLRSEVRTRSTLVFAEGLDVAAAQDLHFAALLQGEQTLTVQTGHAIEALASVAERGIVAALHEVLDVLRSRISAANDEDALVFVFV